ncbi:MAG TPA: radical SAM protein [Candidatus Latescibacteria bacterium]|nr:radical SAM protein [Candidatus Latescibacterota bacterium]HQK22361.1 radical SAM protein [Candidatus Latescibacterota bacterium]HRS94987.1 radical SAM protein [Candidatus Latescibacterota bacterium]
MLAFGPIPSRRLGHSLGINNIPPKVCSFNCVYCQVGTTSEMAIERRVFYSTEQIVEAVGAKVNDARASGEKIDYLAFVPDGEPSLDINLGAHISALREFGIPVAVISNSSLIWREDVRADLARADWVSLKVDSVREETWRKIDHSHGGLSLPAILDGAREFASGFKGKLVSETMLVAHLNDSEEEMDAVGVFLAQLQPAMAYLMIPTRPPAKDWVEFPDDAALVAAHRALSLRFPRVELLTKYEGDAFASLGDAGDALLGILAVHPMREDAVLSFLARAGADVNVLDQALQKGLVVKTTYKGQAFYVRRRAKDTR